MTVKSKNEKIHKLSHTPPEQKNIKSNPPNTKCSIKTI